LLFIFLFFLSPSLTCRDQERTRRLAEQHGRAGGAHH
jgi:hypothetical protein